jgi:chemotaxis protein methyltransferase CheR
MDKQTFDNFRSFIYQASGITLGANKEALVCARVSKRMRATGIPDYKDYLDYVMSDNSGAEMVQLLDAISTNVTSFFRESEHFEFVSKIMERWLGAGQRRFRFWSAASSTGEEPYSLGMTLLEAAGGYGIDMKILATDISTRVLTSASAGIYGEEKLKTVPPVLRQRYFDLQRGADGTAYKVKESLRRLIVFKRLNLSTPPFPMKGPLDLVFCCNDMIYFDNEVRRRLLEEIYRLLKPGGYLIVGHAESLTGMVSRFQMFRPSIYVK